MDEKKEYAAMPDDSFETEKEHGFHSKERIKAVGSNLIKSDKLIYTFLRSAVSSQTASWCDLIICFVLFAWLDLSPWLSTAIGAMVGGIVNCIINYRFTFHAKGVDWEAVAVKYALVWLGSLLLNSFGTQAVYTLIKNIPYLETLGFKPDGYFAAARLFVSLMVSWFWNFVMQRYFVYSVTRFDPYAVKFVQFFIRKHSDNNEY